jgi:predicted NUDIX family NTP pyrophosphohydrolase
MPKQSAGILLYRTHPKLQVFLVHPGGPFFKNKDDGHWSIPKGEYLEDEDPLSAAKREFSEETGQQVTGDFTDLGSVKLKSCKVIRAFAVEGDMNHERIESNLFEMDWPPRSGKMHSFPEVDRAAWFTPDEARVKLNAAQIKFVDNLIISIAKQ